MAMEDPTVTEDSQKDELQLTVLPAVEGIFALIFTAEFMLKCFVYGLRQYLSDHWNKLDALIVGISWFGIISNGGGVRVRVRVRVR